MTILRVTRTQQPQYAARLNPRYGNALSLILPSVGEIDLVRNETPATRPGLVRSAAGVSLNCLSGSWAFNTGGQGISVPAGSDWTCIAVISSLNQAAQNSGLFRSGTGGAGGEFVIMQTGAAYRWPWVRVNGTNVLLASSGPQCPSDRPFTFATSFKSGSRVACAWDGAVQHSATTSVITPAFNIYYVGQQGTERIGNLALFCMLPRALSDAELSDVTDNPWQIFTSESRPIFFAPPAAAGGAFSGTWAHRQSAVIGGGL